MPSSWPTNIESLAKQIAHDVVIESHEELLGILAAQIADYARKLVAVIHRPSDSPTGADLLAGFEAGDSVIRLELCRDPLPDASSERAREAPEPEKAPQAPSDGPLRPEDAPRLFGLVGKDIAKLGRLEAAQREALIQAYRWCEGNKPSTARVLGISRKSAYRWLERYSLKWSEIKKIRMPEKSDVRSWEDIELEILKAIMKKQKSNKMRSARILGINVKTLNFKLERYGLNGADGPRHRAEKRLTAFDAEELDVSTEERNLIRSMEIAEGQIGRASRYMGVNATRIYKLLEKYGYYVRGFSGSGGATGHRPGAGHLIDWAERSRSRRVFNGWKPPERT